MEACEAVEKPIVEVLAYILEQERHKVRIDVIDNGAGIPEDVLDEIYMSFYTTKE